MIMLSKLKRFTIIDEKGERAKFTDLAVALLDSDYPVVNYLFYKTDKKIFQLPWDAVRSIDWRKQQITVFDLAQGTEVSLEPRNDCVLLRYEILDALLLDLQNHGAVRANDLQLEEADGKLLLKAADASLEGILRRLGLGLYTHTGKGGLYDWKYVEFLRGNPQAVKSGAGYHLRITRMSPGEIAQLANFVPYLHAAELLTLLPDPQAAKTLEVMPVERQRQVFEELEDEQAARLLAIMAPDAAADLIGRLQTDSMKRFLEKLPREQSARVTELLRYPANTVGGIMTNDVVYLSVDLTIAEARARFRERFGQTDFVYLIYVVSDEENRILRGMIPFRNLLVADDSLKLEAIMNPYIAALSSTEDAIRAAYRVVSSQLAAMPVVGLNNKLLGAVTIDAAIMAITPTGNSENLRIFS
ncbi:MAG: magnesium transporter MgtE N-terminal domain-containing protein [Pyrinomonadaceae bacterium]